MRSCCMICSEKLVVNLDLGVHAGQGFSSEVRYSPGSMNKTLCERDHFKILIDVQKGYLGHLSLQDAQRAR